MKKHSAIIFGATGFIGKWLSMELIRKKYKVTLIVRDINKVDDEIAENVEIIVSDNLQSIVINDGVLYDYFFYIAWSGVASALKNDIDCQLENINIAINVVDFCKKYGCKKIIGVGTVAQYQLSQSVIDVKKRAVPNDYYGIIKETVYNLVSLLTRKYDIKFNWIILASTYGPGRGIDNIISYTIVSLLQNVSPEFGKLNQMWDFVYVEDAVKAIRLVAEKGIDKKIYSVGSNVYMPLNKYVEKIFDIMKKKVEGIGKNNQYTEQSNSSCINNFDLTKDTGFVCEYTFEEGIYKTIEYYKKIYGDRV